MWKTIFAAALLCLATGSLAQPIEQDAGGQTSGRDSQQGPTEDPMVAESLSRIAGSLEASNNDPDAEEDRQRAQDDLKAQQDMANYTWLMSVFTAIALALSSIGIALIYVTLRETRRAATAATDTHNAFIAVERPRLIPTVRWVSKDGPTINIGIQCENIGKSTAYVERICYAVLETGQPDRPFAHVVPCAVPIIALAKAAAAVVSTAPSQHGHDFVGGYVEYRSPFADDHRSYFCFYVEDRPDNSMGETMALAKEMKGAGWPKDT